MSVPICTSEWMLSSPTGTDVAAAWVPRIVAERFTTSTKDGAVERSPDPVPFIASELTWANTTGAQQRIWLEIHRPPRMIITSNPNSYVLDDAVSWDTGVAPVAPPPSATENGIGARISVTPVTVNQIAYTRFFRRWDSSNWWQSIGTLQPEEIVHTRYAALYSTPGSWRAPNNPLQVVRAYWVRLRLWATPEATP
ncbi:hypothetical protein [Nocardia sp. SC052]|uniref:DUF7172 family protein n=1 Tax=Nocardia sichangensis TaxID=3385975 RepID=UPI0039A01C1B